jgi:hypothetical protein
VSWQTRSWNKDKKDLANDSKVVWDPNFSSTYPLVDGSSSILWNNHNQMESSVMLLEENRRWKDMMWLVGSSASFPSSFGMYEGNLLRILGKVGSCKIGSFVSFFKFGMLRNSKYGKLGVGVTMVSVV